MNDMDPQRLKTDNESATDNKSDEIVFTST